MAKVVEILRSEVGLGEAFWFQAACHPEFACYPIIETSPYVPKRDRKVGAENLYHFYVKCGAVSWDTAKRTVYVRR